MDKNKVKDIIINLIIGILYAVLVFFGVTLIATIIVLTIHYGGVLASRYFILNVIKFIIEGFILGVSLLLIIGGAYLKGEEIHYSIKRYLKKIKENSK